MPERGIPKAFRNHEPSVLEQIKTNLDAALNPPVVIPFAQPIPRNISEFGTGQTTVTTIPAQLNVVDRKRIGTKITNLSNVDVWFGNNQNSVTPSTGDLLPAGRGNWVFIPAPSVIFVVVATGTATVAWSEAYDD